MVNWTPHDAAIYPSQPFDANSCWSGSVTILPGGNPAVLYTGIDAGNKQVQNLAVPKNLSDPYLKEWIKPPENPLMVPADQIDPGSFRDPTTAWIGPDKIWRVIIGSKINDTGLAILYRSKDFVNWTKAEQSLYSTNQSGMWECPDFFPVSTKSPKGVDTSVIGPNIKHVLKVSLSNYQQDYYTIGTYNITTDTHIAEEGSFDDNSGLRYDYGKFYASKTFFDSAKNRRILWGWINESSTRSDNLKKGWAGLQATPRNLWLDKSGRQLMQWPISEIEKLRGNQVKWPAKLLERGSMVGITGITAAQMLRSHFRQLLLRKRKCWTQFGPTRNFSVAKRGASVKGALGPFGLLVLASNGLQEYTAVFFRIFKGQDRHIVLMCSDQSRSSINDDNDKTSYGAFLDLDPVHEKLSIRSLIDRSIVESFGGGGKACITARIYPTLAIHDKAHLYAFNNGTEKVNITSLRAWSMKKAQIN
ncbi:Beta-fructofuranosidase insoluble isoenzyme CWINV1 [Citrus sinensis]|nr:Beta-fructofuranosidase insoluble isoenzyme CWINV1 [Citrus sinensis]